MKRSDAHIEVLGAGGRLTIQDLGRRGSQKYGVSVSGVLDYEAAILANRLVGNPIHSAVLESTYGGASLLFASETLIAVTGAELNVEIDGLQMPLSEALIVPKDGVLNLGMPKTGLHAYIAVSGGVASDLVLGSRSTHLASAIGGIDGSALNGGDTIPIGDEAGSASSSGPRAGYRLSTEHNPRQLGTEATIRAIPGPQYDLFDADARRVFWESTFNVSVQSDRQGMRLEGSTVSAIEGRHDIVSDAAYMGAVQIPGDGNPIVLLADRQTTGGYAKIASVIRADLTPLVQLAPGSSIRFEEVELQEAERLAREQQRILSETALQFPESSPSRQLRCAGKEFEVDLIQPSKTLSESDAVQLIWASINGSRDFAVRVEELGNE